MIKVFEMFAGYGTATFALKRLGINHELVGFSEIDKYAIQCFQQNHGSKNYGDCKTINPESIPDFDLLTAGFPCQAFSVAGNMKGEADPRGTLFNEIIRIAEAKKPRWMLLENVKGLTTQRFRPTFNKILSELDRIGYDVHVKVLNTKDYGIPQSRARVWFVCFDRAGLSAEQRQWSWPQPEPLKLFIKDILEPEVADKYYLSEKLQERFKTYLEKKATSITAMRSFPRTGTNDKERQQQLEFREDGCSNTLTSVEKDNLVYRETAFDTGHRDFRESELSPTLSTQMGTGGNNVPMVVNLQPRNGKGIGGKGIISKDDGTTYTVDTANAQAIVQDHGIMKELEVPNCIDSHYNAGIDNHGQRTHAGDKTGRLRRLTPLECFRLQGFLLDEVNLKGLSDTQAYKLAGNGQSINVVEKLFRQLLK